MEEPKEVKCVVWDLDNTIWKGTLLESDDVELRPGIKKIIRTLDDRGIIHSIASKNNHDDAMSKLEKFGLIKYFLYPEINWNAKSLSIEKIRKNLNIHMDSILFVDDDPLERDEVSSEHREILCVNASEIAHLPAHSRLNPRFITEDSKLRRIMYLQDMEKKREEADYDGPKRDFLASLGIQLTISDAKGEDLKRAAELTVRTNQLNATGRTYSYDELKIFMSSPTHRLLVCEMNNKYGAYGKIGLALIEIMEDYHHIKLLLMSCRVMSYGVGTVLLSFIMRETRKAGKKLLADFKATDRNRMMYIAFKFANFKKNSSRDGGLIILENDLSMIQDFPPYMNVITPYSKRN